MMSKGSKEALTYIKYILMLLGTARCLFVGKLSMLLSRELFCEKLKLNPVMTKKQTDMTRCDVEVMYGN